MNIVDQVLMNTVAALAAGVVSTFIALAHRYTKADQEKPTREQLIWSLVGGGFTPVVFVGFPSLFLRADVQIPTVLVVSALAAFVWQSIVENTIQRSEAIAKQVVDTAQRAGKTPGKRK